MPLGGIIRCLEIFPLDLEEEPQIDVKGDGMRPILLKTVGIFAISAAILGCGKEEEKESKVKKAVEEVVTQPFKTYEGAKQRLKEIEKKAQERVEKELR